MCILADAIFSHSEFPNTLHFGFGMREQDHHVMSIGDGAKLVGNVTRYPIAIINGPVDGTLFDRSYLVEADWVDVTETTEPSISWF